MRNFIDRLVRFVRWIFAAEPLSLEVYGSLCAIANAIWVLAFSPYKLNSGVFTILSKYPHYVIAIAPMAAGLFTICALWVNDRRRRRAAAMTAVVYNCCYLAMWCVQGVYLPVVAAYFMQALAVAWVYIRLGMRD